MKKLMFVLLSLITLVALSGCANKNNHTGSSHHSMNHEEKEVKDTTKVSFTFDENPQSGKKLPLTIQVNNKDGKSINDFEIEHEKLMHLIIVSEDLSFFDHLHPEYKGNGLFTISPNFPKGGKYKLFADFVPKNSVKTVKASTVEVLGDKGNEIPLEPEKELSKIINGKEITLSTDQLVVNKEAELTFIFKDANTKNPITDLQPYLGAVGHVVAISEDTKNFLHVHPMNEDSTGPEAKFMTSFPKKGLYKIWGQFQQNGKVFIVSFTVNVK